MNEDTQQDKPTKGFGFIGLLIAGVKLVPKLLLMLIKSAKGLKVASVGASFASYAILMTWQFSLCLIVALFVHEWGHIKSMQHSGMKTKGIYFIPFIGGAAVADDRFPSWGALARCALAGPLIGGLGLIVPCLIIYLLTHDPLWAAIGSFIGLLNLFNLLPVNPLDGGRVMHAVTSSLHAEMGRFYLMLSMFGLIIVAFQFRIGIFAILALLNLAEIMGSTPKWEKSKRRMCRAFRRKVDQVWLSSQPMSAIRDLLDDVAVAANTSVDITVSYLYTLPDELPGSVVDAFIARPENRGDNVLHLSGIFLNQFLDRVGVFIVTCRPTSETSENVSVEHQQELTTAVSDDVHIPKMGPLAIFTTMATYIALCIGLFLMMHWLSDVPGAKHAMELLQD